MTNPFSNTSPYVFPVLGGGGGVNRGAVLGGGGQRRAVLGGGQRRGGIRGWSTRCGIGGRRSTEGQYWGEAVNRGAVLGGGLYHI